VKATERDKRLKAVGRPLTPAEDVALRERLGVQPWLPWWKVAGLRVWQWTWRPGHRAWQAGLWFVAINWLPKDWSFCLPGLRLGQGAVTFGLFVRLGPVWLDCGRQRNEKARLAKMEAAARAAAARKG
jgi:hypothetical protein